MKWLFVLLLALAIFGGAAWFGYNTFVKEEIEVKKEQRGEVTPPPAVDVSLPDFEAAVKLHEDGKLTETRDALVAFIQKYPNGKHLEEARDILGEVNAAILLSRHPSPEKIEYIVKPGDVLAKIARKLQTTPEMIMRMNNMSGTMLRIGDKLLISHPDFSMVIQRKANLVVVLNHGAFFKQYHVREAKLPQWIRLAGAPAYTLYAVPDATHPNLDQAPPPTGLGLAAVDLEELSTLVNKSTSVTIID
jgi:LysM repeat protein